MRLLLVVGEDFFPSHRRRHDESARARRRPERASSTPSTWSTRSSARFATWCRRRAATASATTSGCRSPTIWRSIRPIHRAAGRRRADPAQAQASADRWYTSRQIRELLALDFRTSPPTSRPPTSSARCSISACPRRSTRRSPATICRPTTTSRCALEDRMRRIPGVSDLAHRRAAGLSDLQGQRRSRQGAGTRHHPAAGRLELLASLSGACCCSRTSGSIRKTASTTTSSRRSPQHLIDSVAALSNIPLSTPSRPPESTD